MAKRYLLLKEKRWVESLDLKSSIWKPDRWGSFRSCSSIRFCRSSSSSEDSLSISKHNAEMPKDPIQFQRMEGEFMHVFRKSNRKVKQGGYGNLSYPPRPAQFKFLNGMWMRIILNKRGWVGMGASRPEPASLPSLINLSSITQNYIWNLIFHFWNKFLKPSNEWDWLLVQGSTF